MRRDVHVQWPCCNRLGKQMQQDYQHHQIDMTEWKCMNGSACAVGDGPIILILLDTVNHGYVFADLSRGPEFVHMSARSAPSAALFPCCLPSIHA